MSARVRSVGFVGLGNAGWPMAGQLIAAGFELVVRDQDTERTRSFVAEHEARDGTLPGSFAGVEVVFTMLPHGGIVREALFGSGGIVAQLAPGTVVVDTSSADPVGTRELAAELAGRDISLVDAAVSERRVGDAKRGAITFMVGADDDETFDRVRPLLEAMSAYIFRVGPTGSGHATKTLNNYVSAAGLHAALDSLIAGYRYGLDLATMIDAFTVSTARNISTEGTMKYKALPRRFERRYSLGLLAKDMGIAASLARATGFESELFGLLERAFAAARDDVGYDEDLTASLVHWERSAGVELPPTEPHEQLAEARGGGTAGRAAEMIGLAGLGVTGAALATQLSAAGHPLVVYDADARLAARFTAEAGCSLATTPGALAEVDTLIIVLQDAEAVSTLLLGREQLAGRLAQGTVVVDCSASAPSATRLLADELASAGLSLVDAGLSIPDIGALDEGRINFMLGADDEQALARAIRLLEPMSAHIFHVGRAGAGHAVRTLNDYIAAAGLRGALDGLIVGYRFGLDPATMLDVLNLSTGRNFATEQTLRLHALPRTFDTGYSISSLVHGTATALAFAKELGLATELFELVHRDFASALEHLGDEDVASLLRHWERTSGTELPAATRPR